MTRVKVLQYYPEYKIFFFQVLCGRRCKNLFSRNLETSNRRKGQRAGWNLHIKCGMFRLLYVVGCYTTQPFSLYVCNWAVSWENVSSEIMQGAVAHENLCIPAVWSGHSMSSYKFIEYPRKYLPCLLLVFLGGLTPYHTCPDIWTRPSTCLIMCLKLLDDLQIV